MHGMVDMRIRTDRGPECVKTRSHQGERALPALAPVLPSTSIVEEYDGLERLEGRPLLLGSLAAPSPEDGDQSPEHFVHGLRVWKQAGDIGVEHDGPAPGSEPTRVLPADAPRKVILLHHFSHHRAFSTRLHSLFFRAGLPNER